MPESTTVLSLSLPGSRFPRLYSVVLWRSLRQKDGGKRNPNAHALSLRISLAHISNLLTQTSPRPVVSTRLLVVLFNVKNPPQTIPPVPSAPPPRRPERRISSRFSS